MNTLRRVLCRLFGHPDSRIVWGKLDCDPEIGWSRTTIEQCVRCGAVLGVAWTRLEAAS